MKLRLCLNVPRETIVSKYDGRNKISFKINCSKSMPYTPVMCISLLIFPHMPKYFHVINKVTFHYYCEISCNVKSTCASHNNPFAANRMGRQNN